MYNNDDELYEVHDLDEDIQRREALIEEVKSIPEEAEWKDVFSKIADLKRKWKQIPYWESAYEDKLGEEFDHYMDHFYAKRREGLEKVQDIKKDLIAQAKALCDEENLNQATEKVNELMAQWKLAGSAGRDVDDALWDEFNAARQAFFDRKHQYWEDMQERFSNARRIKEELIKKAEELKDSTDWQKTSEKFRDLMKEWKDAGSAGRDFEDQLWNQFNSIRQKFYDQRGAHYEELHEVQNQHYEAKKALSEQAQEIVNKEEYTREHTETMKKLGVEWKNIGSCGKDKEDEIWKEFRSSMDRYFDGLKKFNEQKHAQWRQRMMDARSRKQELLQKQKRQIQRMQEDIIGLIGERAIQETEEQIEEKKEFIKQLEEELADIEKTLEKE